jgi:cell division protein FtsB
VAVAKRKKGGRVSSERARRRRARRLGKSLAIVAAVSGGLLAAGYLASDNGVRRLFHLRREVSVARERIRATEARIEAREAEADALREDPLAIEAAIREDLGLARPGEWVLLEERDTSLRNP